MTVVERFDPPKIPSGARLAALIWFATPQSLEPPPPRVVQVALVTPVSEPVPEPLAEPDRPDAPAPDAASPVTASDAAPDADAAASAQPELPEGEAGAAAPTGAHADPARTATPPQPADVDAAVPDTAVPDTVVPDTVVPDTVVLDAPGGLAGETAFPTRSSALRGLACARAFGREDDAIGCDGAPAPDFSRFAGGQGAAQIDALTQARFNALAGLYGAQLDPALRRLPGQQGMSVFANRRAGMSGADEMRDSLPPMVPDPAFGD